MSTFDDGVALVTGGSRGIGRAACVEFAARGMTVFTCARSTDGLAETERLAEGAAGEVRGFEADVTAPEQMREIFDRIESEYGRLDLLVNNAGVLGPKAPIEEISLADWRRTMAVNLDGVFICSKLAIGLLRESEAGFVLNVSSSVGRRGRGGWGPYAVSKHGVEGLTDTLADELAEDGACVVSVNPGGTATEMRQKAYPDEDPSTIPTPERVARTFAYLVEELTVDQTGGKFDSRELFENLE
ncbi:MAG: SDR family NAD(P)-dependent oxidoreductase [Persicimonas sp.]